MGRQARAAGRATRRRHRIHQRQIYRCLHQRLAGLAGDHVGQSAERRPIAAACSTRRAAAGQCERQFDDRGGDLRRRCRRTRPQDPQLRDNAGVNFRINDPPLVIGESSTSGTARRAIPDSMANSRSAAGVISATSAMNASPAQGVSLASPLSSGTPASRSQNSRYLFGVEQKIYRVGNDDDRGIGIFARVSSSPSDRNLIDRYADGGIEFIGLSDARPKDKFRHRRWLRACFVTRAGARCRLSADGGPELAAAAFEALATAVYQYEVHPGWTLQPNFQYFAHPGGGATNPLGSNPENY